MPLQNGRANGALRKLGAVQEGVLRQSARRGDEYVDQVLWSLFKEDWGDIVDFHSPRGFIRTIAPMNRLPLSGRLYVASVIVTGAVVMAFCLRHADFLHQPVLFAVLIALATITAALKLTLPFTRQRFGDVGGVRGRLRVAAAARTAQDDGGGGDQRVGCVPSEQEGTAARSRTRCSAWRRWC